MTEEDYINQVTLLIHGKNWIDEDFRNECLRRLSRMSSFLDENNRQMIVDLLRNFDKFFGDSYTRMLNNLFKSIPKDKYLNKKKAFCCGIVKLDDQGKIKSGSSLAYRMHELDYNDFFKDMTIQPEPLSEELLNQIDDDTLLILLDDFLGTGSTFFKMINHFKQLQTMKESIIVISLVTMEDGFNKIKSAGFDIYSQEIRKKGISDLTPPNKKNSYLEMMKAIGKKMNVNKKYRLGYGKSESLVSMIRTPNNTFPVFWCPNDYFKPPFERKAKC